MNPLTVNPAILVDHVLRSHDERRVVTTRRSRRSRRTGRAAQAARSARAALERAGL